ncbi:MAG TPA: zinc ribbon domain-containing protein [Pyrinomonadaceae bacterium]|jgi:hypothetical protein
MFCPSCGQKQVTEDTRFCSRCGLLLTGVTQIINNGGALPQNQNTEISKKKFFQKKGFKQGLFIFLLSFIIIPIIAVISIAVDAEPYAVIISSILLGGGSLIRMIYSMLFEAGENLPAQFGQENVNTSPNYLAGNKATNALPPQQSIPVSNYAPPKQGNWLDTNDLAQPSVTEHTTKLLDHEE